ncbi:MAG: glutathione peroxidase [Candidatus Latescibacteria bacterium]|nr:glutathione peroxidase [Candidatus Latescibacterota bacterium]
MKALLLVMLALAAAVGLATALLLRSATAAGVQQAEATPDAAAGSFYDLNTRTLAGEPAALDLYKGKVTLVVNTASKCGLTPQYEGLEKLHRELSGAGFVVLGFPSNDFMGQEPGTPEEIRAFCDTKYQVTFPLFEKVAVKGDGKCDLYRFLTAGGLEEPTWNFTKYLVGRDGHVIARFGPRTAPDDPELRTAIDTALAHR